MFSQDWANNDWGEKPKGISWKNFESFKAELDKTVKSEEEAFIGRSREPNIFHNFEY